MVRSIITQLFNLCSVFDLQQFGSPFIANVNASMDFFNEPDNIWVASSDGNLAEVKKLVESGVQVNSQDEYGYSPL